MGCGVGASALVLARSMPAAKVLAIDSYPAFVDRLRQRSAAAGLSDRIAAQVANMGDPWFLARHAGSLHLIWAESSIYAIGRLRALRAWRDLLRPGGCMVFSDVVWTVPTAARSPAAVAFWAEEYPEMTDRQAIVRQLFEVGLTSIDDIAAPRSAWSNYYDPLRTRIAALRPAIEPRSALDRIVATMEREITLFDSDDRDFASVLFVARAVNSAA
jgi:predicted O-methyltransferase YrrM